MRLSFSQETSPFWGSIRIQRLVPVLAVKSCGGFWLVDVDGGGRGVEGIGFEAYFTFWASAIVLLEA